jgi:phosphoribosylamine--glycine ligase
VLVVGSGGREHALAWALGNGREVVAAPGNPGIAEVAECVPIAATDADGLVALCKKRQFDLVVIGPEAPLIEGLADRLRSAGHTVLGPGANLARLEGDKAWAKEQMRASGVPTAASQAFTDPDAAMCYVLERLDAGTGVAVKASGPALGKGVVVTADPVEAGKTVDSWMRRRELGEAGAQVVVEDRLVGREFSLITLVSESGFASLPVAQDYKRVGEGDTGPNTGGMGSRCPTDWVTPVMASEAEARLVVPLLRRLSALGMAYRGVLFTGVMQTEEGPYCLEYNVRFGDPETQSIVRVLGPGLGAALEQAAAGGKPEAPPVLAGHSVTVVIASEGYPYSPKRGQPILIRPLPPGVVAFHSGTAMDSGRLVVAGGRVLSLSALAEDPGEARALAYAATRSVDGEGLFARPDIGAG